MKVVVTSIETVKPSCPTPDHLRSLQLSFLDQIHTRNGVPFIFYYNSSSSSSSGRLVGAVERCELLKKSLAETLTQYYPLAGRVKDDGLFIDCNDEGVIYLEAQVDCQLSQLVAQPNHPTYQLNKLIPFDQLHDMGDVLLGIQANIFHCGGMAIGMCFSHKLMDVSSFVTFANFWAGRGRNNYLINTTSPPPRFDLATLFPPRDLSSYKLRSGMTNVKTVAKTFIFSVSVLSNLKAKYTSPSSERTAITNPSRVEALSTFIWSRFVAATQGGSGAGGKSNIVIQAVNLRPRLNPPLPETYFGNLSRFAIAAVPVPSMDSNSSSSREEVSGYVLVARMREAISKIDDNYVKKLQEGDPQMIPADQEQDQEGHAAKGLGVPFAFSSIYKFPLYEVDFGWGRPTWVSMAAVPFERMVAFLPTPSGSGDGLQVMINMKEDDMVKLEANTEFIAVVSQTSVAGNYSKM